MKESTVFFILVLPSNPLALIKDLILKVGNALTKLTAKVHPRVYAASVEERGTMMMR